MRADPLTNSGGTMGYDHRSQLSSENITITFKTQIFFFFSLIRESGVRGTFTYIAHQYVLLNRTETILRI